MSTYTSFIKLTTISADDMNNNFNHCFAGDWLPLSGATLTTDTTETLDMGSQTDAWNTLYCNNLNIDGEITKAFNLIAEVTLSATASAIEFDGLNGDKDEVYLIVGRIKATTGMATVSLFINEDSNTSNYGRQYLTAQSSAASAFRDTSFNGMSMTYIDGGLTTTSKNAFFSVVLYSKAGNERLGIVESQYRSEGTFVGDTTLIGVIWNNTASTVTTLKFSGSASFEADTNIQIWAKTTTITARSITITET